MALKRIENFFFLLCLIFLPTQLGRHFWPQFSFIFSLPVDYLSPTLYFWDILTLALLVIWLAGKPKINWTALNLGLIFILSLLPSFFVAKNIGGGLTMLAQLLIALSLGIYISSQEFEKIKKNLMVGLTIGVFYESIIAILEFLLSRSLNLWILGERNFNVSTPAIATFNFLGEVFLRPYATFPHPNVLGAFMVLSSVIIFVLKDELTYLLSFLGLGLAALTSILTFSRAAIVVVLAEVVLGLRKKIIYLIFPFLVVLPFVFIRFMSAFNFDSLSILRREELAGIAIKDFLSSPFIGIGLNNFINETATSSLISGTSRFLQPVHNIFLLFLSETGILGLLGFLGLLVLPIVKLWKKRREKFARILLFCWAVIVFLGNFDHYFLTLPQGQRMLFLIWGLSMIG